MIAGSASEYSYGIIDPIEELAEIARNHNVGLHVDCCLGGFFFPFVEDALKKLNIKETLPKFDFSVNGVTSISMDTHKYAYGPKGLSVLLLRTHDLASNLYYHSTWEGGIYHSNCLNENKSGAIIAGTWAIIKRLGWEGFV